MHQYTPIPYSILILRYAALRRKVGGTAKDFFKVRWCEIHC